MSVEPSEPAATPLEEAKEECAPAIPDIEIGDEGQSLIVDMPGQDENMGPTLSTLSCVLEAVDTPDAVVSRMESTRALDGMQDATWSDYQASWTYHPDDGLDVILTLDSSE